MSEDTDEEGQQDAGEGDGESPAESVEEGHPAEEGLSPEDVDIDPEEVDIDEISDLSTEELLALSGGGYVDEAGNATAFGEGTPADPSGGLDGHSPEPEEQTAEETAENLVESLDESAQTDRSTQEELFSDEWISANTEFDTVEAFFEVAPWDASPGEGLWDVPTEQLDAHAAAHTEYDTWEELSAAAGDDWLESKLDGDLSGL